jgi:hypothetical protein
VPLSGAEAEAALAYKYSPILYLQRDDSCVPDGGELGPAPVDLVLGNSSVRLEGPAGTIYGPQPQDLFLKGPEYYLDFPGQPTDPGCRYKREYAAVEKGFPPVTYARVTGEDHRNGLVLQYWFFYYFNDWNNKHEGDWEMVQLFFKANTPQRALSQDPDLLVYTQHNGGETARWDSGKLEREGSHVVVYVARGSHGNYYKPHSYLGLGEEGSGLGCDVASGPRYRVEPQVIVLPHEPLPPQSPFAWTTYYGKWGQTDAGQSRFFRFLDTFPVIGPFVESQGGEFDGPPGPNATIRWPQPITWQERQRSSSAVVPAAGLLGRNALTSFCGGATFLGNLLATSERWPSVALAALTGSVALAVATAFLAVRSVRYGGTGTSRLRRRRSLAHVFAASGLLYIRRWRLFLTIGAISIPFGLAGSAVSDFVLSKPPFGSLASLYGDSLAIRAFIALQYGLLQLRLLYPLILSAVAVALLEVDAGRHASATQAYRFALSRFPGVIEARLRTLLVMLPLTLSIVGIPVAIYLSVRWNFVEQTVVCEDARGADALFRSDALSRGSFWRIAALSALIAIMLTVSVPLLAALFLFASPLSLWVVNLVAGLFFAALIPYVALCVTLLYFDLVERKRLQPAAAPVSAG